MLHHKYMCDFTWGGGGIEDALKFYARRSLWQLIPIWFPVKDALVYIYILMV
jgi:hypothetical protein